MDKRGGSLDVLRNFKAKRGSVFEFVDLKRIWFDD
jgi:hypothetical protein